MKKVVRLLLLCLFTILQAGIVAGLMILDDLSRKKAGVNHHLMAKKSYYGYWVFSEENIRLMKIALVVLAIVLVVGGIYLVRKSIQKPYGVGISMIIAVTIGSVLWWELTSKSFMEKLFYPYAVLGTAVIFLIEIIKILLQYHKKDRE